MGVAGGPNIKRDGLVFGYDTGLNPSSNFDHTSSPRRYFKGKPSTNLVSTTLSMAGWQGSYSLVDSATKTFNITTQQSNATTTSAWRTFYWSVSSYIGQNVSISADVQFIQETDCTFSSFTIGQGNTGTFIYHIAGSNAADRVTIGDRPYDKTRMTWSGVINATGIVGFTLWINNVTVNNANCTIQISNVQIEVSSYPSPFVNSTRPSTQSLIDLTKSTTIDVSNVSFDSTGQLTFDGTDDYINLGDDSRFDFTNGVFSIEAIVKFPSSWTAGGQYPNLISKGASAGWDTDGWALFGFRDWPSAGQKSWGLGFRNGATNRIVSTADRATDVYLHIVATADGSTMRLYENGVQVSTQSQTINPASNSTNVYIGRGPNSAYFPGDIPVAKIYNQTLTAAEVQQNFKAYKNRFNI